MTEQQEVSLKAACTTFFLNRLNKRLLLFERYLVALSRKGVEPAEVVEVGGADKEEEEEKMDKERVREVDEERFVYMSMYISHIHISCLCTSFTFSSMYWCFLVYVILPLFQMFLCQCLCT